MKAQKNSQALYLGTCSVLSVGWLLFCTDHISKKNPVSWHGRVRVPRSGLRGEHEITHGRAFLKEGAYKNSPSLQFSTSNACDSPWDPRQAQNYAWVFVFDGASEQKVIFIALQCNHRVCIARSFKMSTKSQSGVRF